MKTLKFMFIWLFIFLLFSCKSTDETKTDEPEEKVVIEEEVVEETIEEEALENLDFELNEEMDEELMEKYIKRLFYNLEEKIARGDFDGWYNTLTTSHKHFISDKTNLRLWSDSVASLVNDNIVLDNPKDYFEHIVMKARSGASFKYLDFEFVDEKHVKIKCEGRDINNPDKTDTYTYPFIIEDGEWKLNR